MPTVVDASRGVNTCLGVRERESVRMPSPPLRRALSHFVSVFVSASVIGSMELIARLATHTFSNASNTGSAHRMIPHADDCYIIQAWVDISKQSGTPPSCAYDYNYARQMCYMC